MKLIVTAYGCAAIGILVERLRREWELARFKRTAEYKDAQAQWQAFEVWRRGA